MNNIVVLVIFAIVAVIILVQLYSVLGRKVGFRVEDKVLAKTGDDVDGKLQLERPAEPPKFPNLDVLKSKDVNFNEINFVEKARETYEQVVLAFHRGHWCPYCRLNIVGLAEIQDRIGDAQILAISAERQKYTRTLREESGARFPLLTDVDGGYTLSINLAIWVDDFMSSLIGGAGWDIPGYQGGQAWILPVPSVFIVDTDGIVRTRHVDPDYRRRMELDAVLEGVAALRR